MLELTNVFPAAKTARQMVNVTAAMMSRSIGAVLKYEKAQQGRAAFGRRLITLIDNYDQNRTGGACLHGGLVPG